MSNRMTVWAHRAVVILTVIGFSFSVASAQTTEKKQTNSLEAGKWALQFRIGPDFNIGMFEGTVLSVKKQTSKGSALEVGLSVDLRVSNKDASDETSSVPAAWERVEDYNRESVGITVRKVFYPAPDARVNFLYGVGPSVTFTHSGAETESSIPSREDQRRILTRNTLNTGLSGIIGVEWFATESISFLGQYTSMLQYRWSKENTKSQEGSASLRTVGQEESSEVTFNSSGVKFGLSVYW